MASAVSVREGSRTVNGPPRERSSRLVGAPPRAAIASTAGRAIPHRARGNLALVFAMKLLVLGAVFYACTPDGTGCAEDDSCSGTGSGGVGANTGNAAGAGGAGAGGVASSGDGGTSGAGALGGAAGERGTGEGGVGGDGGVGGVGQEGGAGGDDGSGCDWLASPSEASCLVSDEHAIFVTPRGNDENFGTRSAPVKTFKRALRGRVQRCRAERVAGL